MSKYYEPKITDFHIGFSYEYIPRVYNWYLEDSGDKWVKETFSAGFGRDGDSELNEIEQSITEDKIRVKYLDRKDIESELKFSKDNKGIYWRLGRQGIPISGHAGWTEWLITNSSNQSFSLCFADGRNLIIENMSWEETKLPPVVFNGKAKNRSELKKILIQTGVV